ncbi:MAG: helix-turn-helix transcriptional regulator, partial [Oscillospiraceae bacterium]
VRMNISLSELARRIGQSPQNFSAKLKRGTITDTELVKIADELNISYEQSFTLPNGEKITITNNGGKANG